MSNPKPAYGEGLMNSAKFIGCPFSLATAACYGFMAYFAGNNVKDPLKSAYIANYAFIIMMAIPVAFLSIPFTKLVYTRFEVFAKSLKKGMFVLVAWWLSLGVFIITDPVFNLSKDNQGNNIERSVYWIMVATACGLALASAIGFIAATQAPDSDGKPTNG